jgi:4'-phosphopantetheinyl transferase
MMQSALEIYYTDINEWKESALFEKGLSLVHQKRRNKVESCRFEDDRCRSLAAGLLIRYACLRRGLDYGALHFFETASGKPQVEGLQYNVSHSGDYAVLVAGDVPAGIDVEKMDARFGGQKGAVRLEHIIRKTFDDKEKEKFASYRTEGSLSGQALRFAAEVWTRKESFAKECGAGLGMDFSEIHTQDAEGFFTFELPGHYTVSVFSREPVKIEFPVCVRAADMLRYNECK